MEYSSIQQRTRKRKSMRFVRRYRLHIAAVIVIFLISLIVMAAIAGNAKPEDGEIQTAKTQGTVKITPDDIAGATPTIGLVDQKIVDSIKDVANEPEMTFTPNEEDVVMLARLIWGEARGVSSDEQKAAVVWCVLNRVDSGKYPDTIAGVVTQKSQFCGYSESFPATDEFMEIAEDVLVRWYQEKAGIEDVGRVLPSEYLFFTGDGVRNYFSVEWRSSEYYDWSLPSPYAD